MDCYGRVIAVLVWACQGLGVAAWAADVDGMDRLYRHRVEVQSSRYLAVHLFNVAIDHGEAAKVENYAIISPDDPRYDPARRVRPRQGGSRARTIRVPLRHDELTREAVLFLELPEPMLAGRHYGVAIRNVAKEIPELPPVLFDDGRTINDIIRVNQLGYPAADNLPRRAYVGQYMGSAGAMPLELGRFELRDAATGEVAFAGKAERRAVNEPYVGQQVYELDFGGFTTPGRYQLHVPGVGMSYPFSIGAGAINPAYVNVLVGNLHQRCAWAVPESLSRHHRDACHLDDAFLDKAVESLPFLKPKNPPLYPAAYDGRRQPAVRGHHDAGDYGKYTSNGAAYVANILTGFDLFPQRLNHDHLGLPTSENGIPDLVDEVKWELDWLEHMQDVDGGVFGIIKPNNGGYEGSLPAVQAKRLFYPKDTIFTAAFAGALAHAARSPVIRKHFPEDAERYLEKAKDAWKWLQKNDRCVEYFHYGAVFGDWDERCWAAASLYAATGQEEYHRYFLEHFEPERRHWGWVWLSGAMRPGAVAYATLEDRPVDRAMKDRCVEAVRQMAEFHVACAAAHPYRMTLSSESIRHGRFGWVFPDGDHAFELLVANAVSPDARYVVAALDNLHYILGASPHGYVLMTGLGWKRNIEVVDNESTFDGIIEPAPGLPLGIGTPGFYWINKYGKSLGEGVFPEWPLLNRWYDGFNVQSEFTIPQLGGAAVVYGYFAEFSEPAPQAPLRVRIEADRLRGPAPLDVQFRAVADSAAGDIVQVFWDFDDESFSTRMAPNHVFDRAGGVYRVAVTVVDARGRRAYDQARVACVDLNAGHPTAPFTSDAATLALLHLDGDLQDAGPHGLKVHVRTGRPETPAYRFSEEPPIWMAKPAGQCLVLQGAEHFEIELPEALLSGLETQPLALEMMVYVEDFAGWGYKSKSLVLGIEHAWDSWLGWKQGTWDRPRAPHFGGANGTMISAEQTAGSFPRKRWCHVRIEYDGRGGAELCVNGKRMGGGEGRIFRSDRKGSPRFTFGPLIGRIDEVRVLRLVSSDL